MVGWFLSVGVELLCGQGNISRHIRGFDLVTKRVTSLIAGDTWQFTRTKRDEMNMGGHVET